MCPIKKGDTAGEITAGFEPGVGRDPQPAGDFVVFSISLGSSVRCHIISGVHTVKLPGHSDMIWVEFFSHTK